MSIHKLTEPHKKKRRWAGFHPEPPFPVPIATVTEQVASSHRWYHYTAELIDGVVMVKCSGDMEYLFKMGFFGKGNLSRSRPEYCRFSQQKDDHFQEDGKKLRIISRRKYLRHCSWQTLANSDCDKLNIKDIVKQEIAQDRLFFDNHKIELMQSNDFKRRKLDSEDSCHSSDENKEKLSPPIEMHNLGVCVNKDKTEMPSANSPENNGEFQNEENDFVNSPSNWDDDDWGETSNALDADPWSVSNESADPWQCESKETSDSFWGTDDTCVSQEKQHLIVETSDQGNSDCKEHSESLVTCDNKIKEGETSCNMHDSNDSKNKGGLLHNNETSVESFAMQTENTVEHHILDSNQDNENENSAGSKMSDNMDGKTSGTSFTGEQISFYDPRCLSDEEDADLLVVNDTDDDDDSAEFDDDYQNAPRWRPVAKAEPFCLNEYLQLSLVEAFFLSYGLGCLVLFDEEKVRHFLSKHLSMVVFSLFCQANALDLHLHSYIS